MLATTSLRADAGGRPDPGRDERRAEHGQPLRDSPRDSPRDVRKSATIGRSRAVRGFLRQPMPLPSARDLPTRTLLHCCAALRRARCCSRLCRPWRRVHPTPASRCDAVLDELGTQGLHLIYSSEVVPASLRVKTRAAAGPPLQVLQEVLAQHGLEAKPVGADTYAIVRAGGARRRQPPAGAGRDDPSARGNRGRREPLLAVVRRPGRCTRSSRRTRSGSCRGSPTIR